MVDKNKANWITQDFLCKFRDKANKADAGALSRDHKQTQPKQESRLKAHLKLAKQPWLKSNY